MDSKIWSILAGFCALLLLSACQQAGSRSGFYASPLQPGDVVEVRRPITVEAGMARIYLQHGRTMGYADTDQYTPFCYFRLQEPLPVPQQIVPGELVVESVWMDEVALGMQRPLSVAATRLAWINSWSPIAYQFHIQLKSPQSVAVLLVCSGAFDNAQSAQPIRLAEVRETLGDYAEVRVRAPVADR